MAIKGSKERVYSGKFKHTVVEDKLHSGNSFRSIGKKYNIPHNMVIYWCKQFIEKGV